MQYIRNLLDQIQPCLARGVFGMRVGASIYQELHTLPSPIATGIVQRCILLVVHRLQMGRGLNKSFQNVLPVVGHSIVQGCSTIGVSCIDISANGYEVLSCFSISKPASPAHTQRQYSRGMRVDVVLAIVV